MDRIRSVQCAVMDDFGPGMGGSTKPSRGTSHAAAMSYLVPSHVRTGPRACVRARSPALGAGGHWESRKMSRDDMAFCIVRLQNRQNPLHGASTSPALRTRRGEGVVESGEDCLRSWSRWAPPSAHARFPPSNRRFPLSPHDDASHKGLVCPRTPLTNYSTQYRLCKVTSPGFDGHHIAVPLAGRRDD